jgi:hypothetical protein
MKYFLCKLVPPRPTFSQDKADAGFTHQVMPMLQAATKGTC